MESKKEARRRATALRRGVSPETRARLSAALCRMLSETPGSVLGIYSPIAGEPDPMPAALAWLKVSPSRVLALPHCLSTEEKAMVFRRWMPDEPLSPDAAGIPSSLGGSLIPDLILIPCLGWSRGRRRLGYGGGYFDRYLAQLLMTGKSQPMLIGAAFAACEVEDVLFDALDIPLSRIITEEGVF